MPFSGPRAARRYAVVLAALMAPAPLAAHPHVFIDGGVDYLFDAEGRLDSLRIVWIYDPLTSLFMLEDLGIVGDTDAALAPDDRQRLAAYQTEWVDGFDGDAYLWDGSRRIGLSGPIEPTSELRDGSVVISFLRRLDVPIRPGPATVTRIYDPAYFTAYTVTQTPRLEGAPAGCRAKVVRFEPTGRLVQLQQNLSEIPVDQSAAEDFGALFAEEVHLTCA